MGMYQRVYSLEVIYCMYTVHSQALFYLMYMFQSVYRFTERLYIKCSEDIFVWYKYLLFTVVSLKKILNLSYKELELRLPTYIHINCLTTFQQRIQP